VTEIPCESQQIMQRNAARLEALNNSVFTCLSCSIFSEFGVTARLLIYLNIDIPAVVM